MEKILYAGSEIMPFAATGGLGDVLGSLPAALKRKSPSCDVRAVMPLYAQISDAWREKMTFEKSIMVQLSWRKLYCGIFSLEKDGVKYYFLDNEYYFKRRSLYGEFDDAERFAFFSMAILSLMEAVSFYPDILHANDWQTALAVIKLERAYREKENYAKIKTLYTIHNIEYQGVYGKDLLWDIFGLSEEDDSIVDYNYAINLTKGAVVCADYITTVSENYAKEIQTQEYSGGLHYVLRQYSYKLCGVVNGIDEIYYNPRTDGELLHNYSSHGLLGKAKNKDELQTRFGLQLSAQTPVIAMISRLASHKGFDLVMSVFDEMMQDDVQFILLGTGDPVYEAFFREAQRRYPGRVSINLTYDRALAKQIYAGADLFLMPSKSEACGLSQMIASRYGTVPIVRETGGLYDTIKPYGVDRSGNGFTFASYNAQDMLYVIREAQALYRDTENWKKLVVRAMRIDFSWNHSADLYSSLYERLIR